MRSSERRRVPFLVGAAIFLAGGWPSRAEAQQQGFALERLYQSAPGGGWVVMDDLSMRGELGGDAEVTSGYSLRPFRVTDGSQHLAPVSDQAFVDVGVAVTFERYRLYLNLTNPLVVAGQSGTVGGYQFTDPATTVANDPDLLTDVRIGFDARLLGDARSAFRLGAGAQLFIPNGNTSNVDNTDTLRPNYGTDGTFRAMLRLLFAGDVGAFTYAGQLGAHVRPRDDAPAPGPQGSELLFGVAAGGRFPLTPSGSTALVVGPEVYGESAFRSFLGSSTTGVEGLLTGRVEGTGDDGGQMRVKIGTGGGLSAHFGAPEWRVVVGIELFDHASDRDKDGVTDSKDACPDTPGPRTKDPGTSGCPARTE